MMEEGIFATKMASPGKRERGVDAKLVGSGTEFIVALVSAQTMFAVGVGGGCSGPPGPLDPSSLLCMYEAKRSIPGRQEIGYSLLKRDNFKIVSVLEADKNSGIFLNDAQSKSK